MARQYGMYGIAGLVHREELTKAVTTLRLLVGERYIQSLSVQDTAIGLYYLTAFKRGCRGSDPFHEEKLHRGLASQAHKSITGGGKSTTTGGGGQGDSSQVVSDRVLQHLEEVASICQHCYKSNLHEMERLAHLCHNLCLVASMPASKVLHTPKHCNHVAPTTKTGTTSAGSAEDETQTVNEYMYQVVPAFQLFVRGGHRTAVLVIRGTADISDAMLDAAAVPEKLEDCDDSTAGDSTVAAADSSDGSGVIGDVSADSSGDASGGSGSKGGYRVQKRARRASLDQCGYWAHEGMNFAAQWIEAEVRPVLAALVKSGYHLIITGHSLGEADLLL